MDDILSQGGDRTAPVSVNLAAPGLPAEPDGIGGPVLPWAGG